MRLVSLSLIAGLAALVAVPSAAGQDATQDLRLRVVQNDAVDGGTLVVAVESRTGPERAPNTSLGSATIDIKLDPNLTPAGFSSPLTELDSSPSTSQPGYQAGLDVIQCSSDNTAQCARFGVTSTGVGPGGGFSPPTPGFDVPDTYTELVTLSFTHSAASAANTQLTIERSSLSIGYYDQRDDSPDNSGVIEDNTGTVGDDVVAFETIQDLTIATVTLGVADTWHLLGVPGAGETVDGLVDPFRTQGFTGADDESGPISVALWNETTGEYVAPPVASGPLTPGIGAFVFAFPDQDGDGSDDAFPITSRVTVDPVNDLGSPVNNASFGPNPYLVDLPFALPVTYTTGTGVAEGPGWNMLSNPSDGLADWDQFTRVNVNDAVYTWEPDAPGGPQYQSYVAGGGGTRADGIIAPFEGFWAEANSNGPALVMESAAYSPAMLRQDALPAIRLAVAGEVAGIARGTETVVLFEEGGSAARDHRDAVELAGMDPLRVQLFTVVDGEALDVDVRPALATGLQEIPFDVEVTGATDETRLTLTWPDLASVATETSVYVRDLDTGSVTDLRAETGYTFSVAPTSARTRSAGPARPAPLRRAASETARGGDDSRFVLIVGATSRPVASDPEADAVFELLPPTPNPARGQVAVRFTLDAASPTRVTLHDMLGREVGVLADGSRQAGAHQVAVETGRLAPGVYVVRLQSGGQSAARRITIVR